MEKISEKGKIKNRVSFVAPVNLWSENNSTKPLKNDNKKKWGYTHPLF